MNAARTQRREDNSESLVFHVFDVVHRNWNETYLERRYRVDTLAESERIKIVPMAVAQSQAEFEAFRTKCRADGFEGVMVKTLYGYYVGGRSSDWLKAKDVLTFDARIVGLERGKGRYGRTLGALIVEGEYEGRTVRTKVGSGFSDEQRHSFWDNRRQLRGSMVEIQCQEITKGGSARFPVFLRRRLDRCA